MDCLPIFTACKTFTGLGGCFAHRVVNPAPQDPPREGGTTGHNVSWYPPHEGGWEQNNVEFLSLSRFLPQNPFILSKVQNAVNRPN